jgi:hypothetical protein
MVHGTFVLMSFTILPESLTKTQMQTASAQYREHLRMLDEQERTWLVRIQRLFTFLKPLTIFFPEPIENPNASPLKGRKWDWNLTLVALAYGFTISIMVRHFSLFLVRNSNLNQGIRLVQTSVHVCVFWVDH